MLFRKSLTITFEEIQFLERRCLEEGGICEIFCLYGQRLLEDDVNKKKCVYWRIYHILAFLYSFILDVHGYFGLKLHSQILSMFICLWYCQVLSNTMHTLVYSSSVITLYLLSSLLIIIIKRYSLILFSNWLGFNTNYKKIKSFELLGKEYENI